MADRFAIFAKAESFRGLSSYIGIYLVVRPPPGRWVCYLCQGRIAQGAELLHWHLPCSEATPWPMGLLYLQRPNRSRAERLHLSLGVDLGARDRTKAEKQHLFGQPFDERFRVFPSFFTDFNTGINNLATRLHDSFCSGFC